jgi:hypothetical protein
VSHDQRVGEPVMMTVGESMVAKVVDGLLLVAEAGVHNSVFVFHFVPSPVQQQFLKCLLCRALFDRFGAGSVDV